MGGRRLTAMVRSVAVVCTLGLLGVALTGCLVQPSDSDADESQEAIGTAESELDEGTPPEDFGDEVALSNPAAGNGGDGEDPTPEPWTIKKIAQNQPGAC